MVALGTLKPSPVQTNIEGAYLAAGKDVKPEFVLVVVICLATMSVTTPALTASRQIQDFCSSYTPMPRFGIEVTMKRSWPPA
jgi:hypothetical protein